MKDLLETVWVLDVHNKSVACILFGLIGKTTVSDIRKFITLIPDMVDLYDGIVSGNCHHVAMESIGIYWQSIYEIIEETYSGDIALFVVNTRYENCFETRRKNCEQKQVSYYIRECEKRGYHIEAFAYDSLWIGSYLVALFVVSSCWEKTLVVNVRVSLLGTYFRSKKQ